MERMTDIASAVHTLLECQTTLTEETDSDAFGTLLSTTMRSLSPSDHFAMYIEIFIVVQRFFAARPELEMLAPECPMGSASRVSMGITARTLGLQQGVTSCVSMGTAAGAPHSAVEESEHDCLKMDVPSPTIHHGSNRTLGVRFNSPSVCCSCSL